MTQRQRVLTALEDAGSLGVSPVDFLGPQVVDGGSPILRLAPRVEELRKQGYRISSYRQPDSTVRYVLLPSGLEEPRHVEDGERDGFTVAGRVGASEGLVVGSQHPEVVVDTGLGGASPADCPPEGLFSTDDYRPKPGYPR